MATFFLLLIYLTFISLGLPDSLLGAAWPVMRLELGAPLDAAGIVTMVITGGTIVSSLLSERMIRRFGTGRVTAVSVLATALALLGFTAGNSVVFLVLLAVPLGLGAGAVDAGLNNYVALHYKAHHMSWLHCFWGVGASAGPLILAAFMQQNGNWRGGYLAIGLVQSAVALLLFASLPLWKRREATHPSAPLAPEEEASTQKGSPFKIPGVPFALITFFFYCAAELATGLWGSSFLVEMRGFTEAAAARGASLFYIGITVGRLITGFLTAVMSSKQLVRTGILLFMAGAALLLVPFAGLSVAGLVLVGLGCAPIFPTMLHETPARFGKGGSQKIMGLQMAFAYIGNTAMPPVVGFVARRTGMFVLPLFLLAFGLCMLLASEKINAMMHKRQGTAG